MNVNYEFSFTTAAHQIRGAVVCGLAIFVSGCLFYAMGASALWAWGGTVLFAGLCAAGAILGGLILRQAGRELDRLQARVDSLGKFACCGCGHPLNRHDDPNSPDGYGCRDCNCQAVHPIDEGMVEPR